MLDREPFLRTIFATPDDDTPRLVFADWLEERGDDAWAQLIRVQCEMKHDTDPARLAALEQQERELVWAGARPDGQREGDEYRRGFHKETEIAVTAGVLSGPDDFRRYACAHRPHWYGAKSLKITDGRIASPTQLDTLLASPVTENVTTFDLSGRAVDIDVPVAGIDAAEFQLDLTDFRIEPAIAVRMVEELCQRREARRIVTLDLRDNELDNDALRALARSTNFIRLQKLYLSGISRFRGRVWQQVLERFGEVVE